MKHRLYIAREPNFQKLIITSAVLHILFIALVAVPIKTKKREYKSYFVNIVTPAQLQKSSAVTAGKTRARAVKKKIPVKRRAQSKKGVTMEPGDRVIKELDRLRAITALSKKKKEKEMQLAKVRESEEAVASALENLRSKKRASISIGRAIPGTGASVNSESYEALVIMKIQDQWIHADFASPRLEAVVSFRMDNNGNVESHKIEKSSGNYLFDRTAVKAILKASPFPTHPVEKEIEVRFHL